MVSVIEGNGTRESVWRPFLQSLGLPRLSREPTPAKAVVVAPHPDDEVLGIGGLLALLARAGTQVDVLSVTDGEASHPGGSIGPRELAARRATETAAALRVLGLPARPRRLWLPDGGAEALEQSVVDAVRLEPATWLLGPWEHDGHPDHEAVGRACARIARRDGSRLLAYPVWMWHWATPDDPQPPPWHRALQIGLPPHVRAAKARAIAEFVTQLQPIGPRPADAPVLPPYVLERFTRPSEVVFG